MLEWYQIGIINYDDYERLIECNNFKGICCLSGICCKIGPLEN